MCQVNGPRGTVGCAKCGLGYYEKDPHTCKIFVPFKTWDADLQRRAQEPLPESPFWRSCHEATRAVAAWPEWKRRYAWQEEFWFSVKEIN